MAPAYQTVRFNHYNLGHVAKGTVVVVSVQGNAANVRFMDYSPWLADRVVRSTATQTVEEIAAGIVNVIRNPPD